MSFSSRRRSKSKYDLAYCRPSTIGCDSQRIVSECFVQTRCLLQLLKIRISQALQVLYAAILYQLQGRDLVSVLRKVDDHFTSVLPRLDRSDRGVMRYGRYRRRAVNGNVLQLR